MKKKKNLYTPTTLRGIMQEELTEYEKQYLEESKLVGSHYRELQRKYADKIIAVDNHHVIAFGENGTHLLEEAKKKLGRDCTFTTFITSGAEIYWR